MSLLDQFGLVLQDGGGNNVRITLREIVQAVAEDDETRKLIGAAIVEAPMPSTIVPLYSATVDCIPSEVLNLVSTADG